MGRRVCLCTRVQMGDVWHEPVLEGVRWGGVHVPRQGRHARWANEQPPEVRWRRKGEDRREGRGSQPSPADAAAHDARAGSAPADRQQRMLGRDVQHGGHEHRERGSKRGPTSPLPAAHQGPAGALARSAARSRTDRAIEGSTPFASTPAIPVLERLVRTFGATEQGARAPCDRRSAWRCAQVRGRGIWLTPGYASTYSIAALEAMPTTARPGCLSRSRWR